MPALCFNLPGKSRSEFTLILVVSNLEISYYEDKKNLAQQHRNFQVTRNGGY